MQTIKKLNFKQEKNKINQNNKNKLSSLNI
jgi:hypothetical protein